MDRSSPNRAMAPQPAYAAPRTPTPVGDHVGRQQAPSSRENPVAFPLPPRSPMRSARSDVSTESLSRTPTPQQTYTAMPGQTSAYRAVPLASPREAAYSP